MAGKRSIPVQPSTVPYFYGRITREEAEHFLRERGLVEGSYLLRESINPLGNYAISICHKKNVHHYSIEKKYDGNFMIAEGKPFPGPIELIEHHKKTIDGFVTKPTQPCNRSLYQPAIAFRGMTYTDLERELYAKAESMKNVRMETALGPQREHLLVLVAKDLHQKMPWFHGKISREEADQRLTKDGHKDGKFLVRLRDDKKTFALTVSFGNESRHYMVEKKDKFHILGGPTFDCIMMMVDHYHNKADGLLCKLTCPCVVPNFDKKQLSKYIEHSCDNLAYESIGRVQNMASADRRESVQENGKGGATGRTARRTASNASTTRPLPMTPPGSEPDVPPFPAPKPPSHSRKEKTPLPSLPNKYQGDWDDPEHAASSTYSPIPEFDSKQLAKIYDRVPRNDETFSLQRSQLTLNDEDLGAGQFGSVKKGKCRYKGKSIPVAIKTLKSEDVTAKDEMLKEAKFMANLSHKNIIRMIGVCDAECIMLVLELAPLGPLNTHLRNNKDTAQSNIVELMWQVAQGMAFLQGKNFVHRDLAARNVLLVDKHLAKISDFGMSKAVGRDHNYYEAKEAGKWPLKWYAPECVYFWKFDSKSDVWSYGVTLWEATSYGDKPYKKKKGPEILKFLVEENKRLPCPERCPESVYDVMLQCWQYEKADRPTFIQLEQDMEFLYSTLMEQRL